METKEEVISNADSKGLIENYLLTATPNQDGVLGRSARTDPKVALNLVRNDPVVRASVIKLVDKVVESGWRLQPAEGNQKSKLKELEKKLKKVRFDRLLRKLVFNLVMYNNAFVEIRKKGGELSDLNLLETSFMKIDADDHGNVLGYYQEVGSPKTGSKEVSKAPYWQPEEVVHFKLDDFTTNLWSEFNIEAIYETILIKDYIRQWLMWFFKTNQLRPLIAVEGTNGTKMKEFMAYLKAAENHIGKPIPVEGKITITVLQDFAQQGTSVMQVLAWCDGQIRQLLQVPDIAAGISDNGGRADGAEAREYMNTRVFNIHRLLEDDITYDMFPKIGHERVEFVFGILDETVRTRVFETVQIMRNSMFTEDAILEYLEEQGIVFKTAKPLMSQEDIMQMSNKALGTGNEGMKGNKSADAAQSRKRQNSQDVSDGNKKVAQA
jgi:hypothetical protein